MFKKAGAIASGVLKSFLRDKLALLWLIFLPIIWISIMGAMSGGGGDERIPLGIVSLDSGRLSQSLIDALSGIEGIKVEKVVSEEKLRQMVTDGIISLGLVIPEDFSSSLEENRGHFCENDLLQKAVLLFPGGPPGKGA